MAGNEWEDAGTRSLWAPLAVAAVVLLVVGIILGRLSSSGGTETKVVSTTPDHQATEQVMNKTERGAIRFVEDFLQKAPDIRTNSSKHEFEEYALSLMAPSATQELRDRMNLTISNIDLDDRLIVVPIAYQSGGLHGDEIRLRLWVVSSITNTKENQTVEGWLVHDFRLEWAFGSWRLAEWETTPGPQPKSAISDPAEGGMPASTPDEINEWLDNSQRFDYDVAS